MKRLVELTVADLVASPVWRYEGGSGTDARVAATDRQSLSQQDDEVFLAATDFELADSSRHFGFCFPADDSGIDYLQPVIVKGTRHVSFWFDGPASAEVLSHQWKTLAKTPEQIFPVVFRCLVPVDGREVAGRIEGIETSQGVAAGWPAPPGAEDGSRAAGAPPEPGRALAARPVDARRRGTGEVEKRTARRRKAEMTVEFSQDSFQGRGITGDVSRRGMFVRSPHIPGTGPALRLTVHLPDGRELVLRGRVVRTAADASSPASPGFGLRLADDSPEFDELLSRLRRRSD